MITFPIYTTCSTSEYYNPFSVTSSSSSTDVFSMDLVPSYRKYLVLLNNEIKKDTSSLSLKVSDFVEVLRELFVSLANQPFPKFRVFANEKTEEVVLEFAVAGYKKEDIDVSVRNVGEYDLPQLFIKMNARKDHAFGEDFREIMGNMKTSKVVFGFYIPKYMEVKSANLEDGILRIKMKMEVPLDKKDIKIVVE